MKYVIVIPARYASTRLPGKPLIEIFGKTVLQRTVEQCFKAEPNRNKIIVATDSNEVEQHCKESNFNVIMTSSSCLTGTDRIAEVADKIDAEYFINVQGDEPIINPLDIKKIIDLISIGDKNAILNGYAKIQNEEEYLSRTIPKLVFRSDKRLLYMSRAPIPGNKTNTFDTAWKQICIYAFPRHALKVLMANKSKTTLENIEDIEILRFLEMGFEVQMVEMIGDSIAIDVPEDVEKVKQRLLHGK